jgi:hypothetical protein
MYNQLASTRTLVVAVFATIAVSAPAVAFGQATPAPAGVITGSAPDLSGVSAWGILPWSGIGLGARYMQPLSIDPLLTTGQVRDRFALEVGADLLHISYGWYRYQYRWTEIVPVAGVMWNLWFAERFAAYPKVELGYAFGWASGWDRGWDSGYYPAHGGLFLNGAIGALYQMRNGLTFRAEAGYAGLKLGVGWLF